MNSLVELIIIERIEKMNRLMEQGQLYKSYYDRAIVSLLDGLVALYT